MGIQIEEKPQKYLFVFIQLLFERRGYGKMMGTTHRLGGMLAGIILIEQGGIQGVECAFLLSGAVLGSLLPDIDTAHSSISKQLPVVSVLINVCQKAIRLVSCIFPGKMGRNIRAMTGHRGIFHSLLIPLILTVIMLWQGGGMKVFLTGILTGILSHLLLDMLSGGVPLLMPVSAKKLKLAAIRTGGLIEKGVAAGLLSAVVYLFIY